MFRRSRPLVALLALLALSAFVAESAWALVCAPTMQACEAGMDACVSEVAPSADSGMHLGATHHGGTSPGDSHSAPSDAPVCPMAMAAGGCATAALPAASIVAQPEIVQHDAVLPVFDRTPDLLVVAAHFRPPRA
jgi:hypothetical protein